MTDNDRETILSKIQKMLALATSDNVGEAENAAAMAQEWLIKYNVTEEELNEFGSVKNEKIIEVRTPGKNGNNRSAWYASLAHTVAKANLCTLLTSGAGLIWIGKKTNIEVAQYIFENLARDLMHIADLTWTQINEQQKHQPSWNKVHGKTWKNNFFHGANKSISARLNASLKQLKEADNVNALVVHNDIELKEFMNTKYPSLRYFKNNLNLNRSGYEAGKAVGSAIQFKSGVGAGGSSGPKLLGKG